MLALLLISSLNVISSNIFANFKTFARFVTEIPKVLARSALYSSNPIEPRVSDTKRHMA